MPLFHDAARVCARLRCSVMSSDLRIRISSGDCRLLFDPRAGKILDMASSCNRGCRSLAVCRSRDLAVLYRSAANEQRFPSDAQLFQRSALVVAGQTVVAHHAACHGDYSRRLDV